MKKTLTRLMTALLVGLLVPSTPSEGRMTKKKKRKKTD
jgi:hypothetical protein